MSGVKDPLFIGLTVDLGRLTALTRRVAAEVLAGRHEVRIDPERRSYRRLRCDDAVEVWLIGWASGQATELHDHGDSLGALTVVSGVLSEQCWAPHRGVIRGPVAPCGPQPGLPDRARARRRQPLVGGGGQRARLLAAAHRDVLLRGRRRGPRPASRADGLGRLARMTSDVFGADHDRHESVVAGDQNPETALSSRSRQVIVLAREDPVIA